MPRSKIIYLLLFAWLFAIVAPSVISMLNTEKKPIVTVNLNEEEHHDQGKKTLEEKKLIEKNLTDFSLLSQLQNPNSTSFYLYGNSDPNFEVFLPPPESFI